MFEPTALYIQWHFAECIAWAWLVEMCGGKSAATDLVGGPAHIRYWLVSVLGAKGVG